jgi:hypothetical protein
VWSAWRQLKDALRAARGASAEERARIAAVLAGAAAKIRGRD